MQDEDPPPSRFADWDSLPRHRRLRGPFPLGRLVATPGVLRAIATSGDDLLPYLARHARCDSGTVDREDWAANDRAVREDMRVLSAYELKDGTRVWIITEADRSVTTLLLPDEY